MYGLCELIIRNIFRNNLELYLEENIYTHQSIMYILINKCKV